MDTEYEDLWNRLVDDELIHIPIDSKEYNLTAMKLSKDNQKEFLDHMERDILEIVAKDNNLGGVPNIYNTLLALFLIQNTPSQSALVKMFLNSKDIGVRITSFIKPGFPLQYLLDKYSYLQENNPHVLEAWEETLVKRKDEIVPTLRNLLIGNGTEHVDSMPDDMVKRVWGYDDVLLDK
jgi:hypothetical protein